MASQLASNIRCQRVMHCTASYGERGSSVCTLSHGQTNGYHRIRKSHSSGTPQDSEGNNNFKEHNNNMARDQKGAKLSTKLGRQQAQKLHRLGFSYLASSFLYIVTKVKALYNGFLGDVTTEPRMVIEAPMTEAYFSVPVLPN